MKYYLPLLYVLFPFIGFSQSNVRAWYADGQVFVVWSYEMPIEETYAIYSSPTPFTSTSDAVLIGRPFFLEYLGYGLKENLMDTTATYRIPDGQGGKYQLLLNEGLFVFTPHQTGSLYFAVTKWGDDIVVPGENITDASTSFTYDPIGDPVECHLQRGFFSPFDNNFFCFAYCMWSDGRQNHWEGRPDFPIMANAAKNGMPSLFLISAPVNLDTTLASPLSVWLHGGGGIARQSLAGSRREVNINPQLGILLAHDDKVYGYRGLIQPHPDQPTWHFGYAKNYDPFILNNPIQPDTIINYTQRRYLWIDQWLTKTFNIDTNRINIHGHSMGSAGALALAKCFPEHYGSANLFNTGCAGPDSLSNSIYIFGTKSDNFPTNLKNRYNNGVQFYDLWDLYTNCSPERDLPLIKHWHGKNDDNGVMHWSPIVIENFRICDSIGTGIQHFWSERPHGVDLAPAFNDHWIQGIPIDQQTAHDNVNTSESLYRSDASFPAFFNHRHDAKNNDPGTGLIGINNGDGDNWGTWGGYHRWKWIIDDPRTWEAVIWLENHADFTNDNSPENFLTADVAIRRPQKFKPKTGEIIYWKVIREPIGEILQQGITTVRDDDLVVIPQVKVFREVADTKRLIITDYITGTTELNHWNSEVSVFPNPTNEAIYIEGEWKSVTIHDLNGVKKMTTTSSETQQPNVLHLPNGIYFIEVIMKDGGRKSGRFVKI